MIQNLEKILDFFEDVNKNIPQSALDQGILEERENIKDFKELEQTISQILKRAEQINKNNVLETKEIFGELYANLTNVVWHVDQIHNLMKKMIIAYAKSHSEKD